MRGYLKVSKLICENCGAEPFGVESWWVPRHGPILCPDCSDLPAGLNIIEKIDEKEEDDGESN